MAAANATETYYPPVSFYFNVEFQGLPNSSPNLDASFQDVTGLTATVGTADILEGGENRFTHKVPTRVSYDKLTLKRGLVKDSALLKWVSDSISQFQFSPITLYIHLLNEAGASAPLLTWEVVNAYPTKLSMSNFNSEQNGIAIETLELNYEYFNIKSL
jgi:phage tail-like protein